MRTIGRSNAFPAVLTLLLMTVTISVSTNAGVLLTQMLITVHSLVWQLAQLYQTIMLKTMSAYCIAQLLTTLLILTVGYA